LFLKISSGPVPDPLNGFEFVFADKQAQLLLNPKQNAV